jgi:hypothetical protein
MNCKQNTGHTAKEMTIMFQSKTKKFLSMTLAAMMSLSILSSTAIVAASPAHPGWENRVEEPEQPTPPPPKEKPHREHEDKSDTHSEGEVITAGLVGAVVGAIVAKNT